MLWIAVGLTAVGGAFMLGFLCVDVWALIHGRGSIFYSPAIFTPAPSIFQDK